MARRKPVTTGPDVQIIAQNRRASFDYELGERIEAGLVLIGSEVKSLRNRSANLTDAWATVRNGEAFLEGLRIPLLAHAAFAHKEDRTRKLLLHRKEIEKLQADIERKGMTVIVTKLYFRHGTAKVELALARGKQKADKREAIKSREADLEARSAMDRARKGGA